MKDRGRGSRARRGCLYSEKHRGNDFIYSGSISDLRELDYRADMGSNDVDNVDGRQ